MNSSHQLLKSLLVISFGLLGSSDASGVQAPVGIAISVEQRKTHVIGDAIELDWRFFNQTTNHLAFMWEGCCRINGRIDMKREGPPLIPKGLPRPGHTGFGTGIYNPSCLHCRMAKQRVAMEVPVAPMGPATAHMFAKPVRLRAGGTEKISSRLANWVLLEESGDYTLTGNYLGVHPKQQPQMPRGARLWTEVAVSQPIQLSLLSPTDYLAEREARSDARGVALHLTASPTVEPFSDLGLSVTLSNRAAHPVSLHWPGETEFWLLSDNGGRVPDSRHVITDYGDPVSLAAHGQASVKLSVNAEILAGKPFGRYRAFVELKETDASLRVQSNPVELVWDLTPPLTRRLLHEAGDLPTIGHRNPALKLLRQHLPDLRDTLAALDLAGMGPKSLALATDLREASQLSRLHPKPGSVAIHVAVRGDGSAVFQDPAVNQAFGTRYAAPGERLARIIDLRRHLGWTVALSLRIATDAPLATVDRLLRQLKPAVDGLSGRPGAKAFNRTATHFSEITFARPDAPDTSGDVPYSDNLGETLRDAESGNVRRLVLPSRLTWGEALTAAAPLVDQGRHFEVLIRP